MTRSIKILNHLGFVFHVSVRQYNRRTYWSYSYKIYNSGDNIPCGSYYLLFNSS